MQRSSQNKLNYIAPQLDLAKPNFHDSKAEFLHERTTVLDAYDRLHKVFFAIIPKADEEDPIHNQMVERLRETLDHNAHQRMAKKIPTSISDLIRKNTAEAGFLMNSTWAILDLMMALSDRLTDLNDQEKQFWSVNHRPANYYARAIALRMARLYANQTGKMPTFGTARDGGHPSTNFGRALEEVFGVLDIQASVRLPAVWAIKQLTEADLNPPATGLLGGLLAQGPSENLTGKEPINHLRQIVETLSKGKDN